MNEWLESLQPQAVWRQFRLMCDTPRPSFHEETLRSYLFEWSQSLGLRASIDAAGNLLICKPATTGMEACETVVLQGHLDMVAQKEATSNHCFENDPIETYEQDGWVHAKGTTLGADNGIGVAAILAVLESNDIPHGPIEALFTIEEETSLRGASQLPEGILKGARLLNLDSEDRGDVYIGCAGGVDINVSKRFPLEHEPEFDRAFLITITGLKGGHSGLDINKGLANANVLMARLLNNLNDVMDFRLSSIVGGTLRNAIARDANATVLMSASEIAKFEEWLTEQAELYQQEYVDTDPNLSISVSTSDVTGHLSKSDQTSVMQALLSAPHGVRRMSPSIANVVETSCNLGVIRILVNQADIELSVCLLVRSLVDSQTEYLAKIAKAPFQLIGCEVLLENGYPGWKPEPHSNLLAHFHRVHEQVMGFEPNVKVIHAGLECGIIGAKYPAMEMVSFGPNIRGAHSPSERLQIDSVAEFWNILKTLLKYTPKAV